MEENGDTSVQTDGGSIPLILKRKIPEGFHEINDKPCTSRATEDIITDQDATLKPFNIKNIIMEVGKEKLI